MVMRAQGNVYHLKVNLYPNALSPTACLTETSRTWWGETVKWEDVSPREQEKEIVPSISLTSFNLGLCLGH